MSAEDVTPAAAPRRKALIAFLPLVLFGALATLFFLQLTGGGDPKAIPSALIDRKAPEFDLPPLQGIDVDGTPMPGLASRELRDGVTLINVWASWCGPCRQEHPILMELAKDNNFRLTGINYKDKPENARRFLGSLGNPYRAVGVDASGRAGIDWGVYGVPETFVVDRFGCVVFKFIGPLHPAGVTEKLLPAVKKAAERAAPPAACVQTEAS